jgi:hypothetical protein
MMTPERLIRLATLVLCNFNFVSYAIFNFYIVSNIYKSASGALDVLLATTIVVFHLVLIFAQEKVGGRVRKNENHGKWVYLLLPETLNLGLVCYLIAIWVYLVSTNSIEFLDRPSSILVAWILYGTTVVSSILMVCIKCIRGYAHFEESLARVVQVQGAPQPQEEGAVAAAA